MDATQSTTKNQSPALEINTSVTNTNIDTRHSTDFDTQVAESESETESDKNTVKRVVDEVVALMASIHESKQEIIARGIPFHSVNALVELGAQGKKQEQASILKTALESSKKQYGPAAITAEQLETHLNAVIVLEKDLGHVRRIARQQGLDMSSINSLTMFIRQNPGDGGEKTINSFLAYAMACDIPLHRIDEIRETVVEGPKHVCVLAEVDRVVSPREMHAQHIKPTCVLVWGRKSNTQAALRFAAKHDVPVHYLEDGWIRSSSENSHSRGSYSILKDKTGVYYDSSTPNDLENLLNLDNTQFHAIATPERMAYAQRCREQLVRGNITKYNFTSQQMPTAPPDAKKQVLVVDQTLDDASVRYGGMDAASFENMLYTAIRENPNTRITVRAHPDVVSGHRQGYLKALAEKLGIEISADAINPLLVLKHVDKVYVGTSQLGYEALLCDKQVVVFGQPFYAGWGLSDDRSPVTRRIQNRSIDELFFASHIALARYCNPVTGQPWQLHECLDHVEPWKQKYLRQYLRSPDGKVRFGSSKVRTGSNCDAKLTWAYRAFGDLSPDAEQRVDGKPLFRVEDGFLRSMGLGSDYNAPASLVIDQCGLYLDPARPRDLENRILNHRCWSLGRLRMMNQYAGAVTRFAKMRIY